MIVAWIGYCLLVSALLGVAALAAERALGHYRRPVRWVWAAALTGSLLLPIVAYVAPTLVARFSTVTVSLPAEVMRLPELVAAGASADTATGFDRVAVMGLLGTGLGVLWVLSIVALGGYLFVAQRRLRREMGEWTHGEVLDAPVLMSPDRGPAVVGVRRGVIVMPAWIAELEEDVLRLVFLHEREHQLAGDHRLFALALIGVVAMPWNPFAWWQLRRLRLAIEFDCDRRVIRRGIHPRDYAEALLVVGSRVTSLPLAAAAFAERRPAVERRLRRMTEPLRRLRGARAAAAVGLGALAVVLACGSPLPTDLERGPGDVEADAVADAVVVQEKADADPSVKPMFMPYDVPPVLLNREEMAGVIADAYPEDLRAQQLGGRVELWVYVDGSGEIGNALVKTPSGSSELDDAALAVVRRMDYSPAANRGETTAVWFSQWVTFTDEGFEMIVPPAADARLVQEKAFRAAERTGDADAPSEVKVAGTLQAQEVQILAGDPLVVIDGVLQEEGTRVEDIGTLDIDHVEIVRGAAASALYGARARDGVIQIVTKAAAANTADWPERGGLAEPDPVAGRIVPAGGAVPGASGRQAAPLIEIDGVLQEPGATLSDIGKLDIESVEVLKGEAAVEAYGERGKNGVVRIKTKGD